MIRPSRHRASRVGDPPPTGFVTLCHTDTVLEKV